MRRQWHEGERVFFKGSEPPPIWTYYIQLKNRYYVPNGYFVINSNVDLYGILYTRLARVLLTS